MKALNMETNTTIAEKSKLENLVHASDRDLIIKNKAPRKKKETK